MTHREIPKRQRGFAKSLRVNMTEAEKRLWFRLRAHRFAGQGFRRQSPIGAYIVDFVSHGAQLIIEVDGGQHTGQSDDAERDRWFAKHGYRVLRFWNNDVLTDTDAVLSTILAALAESKPPSRPLRGRPPPRGGGERTNAQ